jgi:hypothetical protein
MQEPIIMTFLGFRTSKSRVQNAELSQTNCKLLGDALKAGDIGQTVTAVQQLILRYYDNVRGQADESFESAQRVALFGFLLFSATVVYVMAMDLMSHLVHGFVQARGGIGVGAIGLIGGSVVEIIAGIQFVLYGRATRQFGAFHICLERTHRYLLAYEMAEQMSANKDETLEKIVCIMANAPMITREDIDGVESGELVRPKGKPAPRRAIAVPSE